MCIRDSPRPEDLAEIQEDELKACNLGYRSKYVVRTAKAIAQGEVSLEKIQTMPYKKAREELLKLFGVGEKVADCICPVSYTHLSNRTKQALEVSLKKLLLQKPLDKITIQDLTGDCGISRMAFYYHFKDIYDLVEWACREDAVRAVSYTHLQAMLLARYLRGDLDGYPVFLWK